MFSDAVRKITMLICVMVVAGGLFVVIVCSAGWVEWDVNALEVAAIGLANSEVGRLAPTLSKGTDADATNSITPHHVDRA